MFKSILATFALSLSLLAGCAPGAQAEPARGTPAPEFTGIAHWLNAPPQTMAGLKGKVVLVEFWTYSCINCIHVQPYVKQWHDRYHDQGLVVIGVHTPEYDEERSTANVRRAIERFGIAYPVAQDNDYATWNAYGNRFLAGDVPGRSRRPHRPSPLRRRRLRRHGAAHSAAAGHRASRALTASGRWHNPAIAPLHHERPMEHADHILVVDDDREIRQMVADYLRKNGLRASEAADGREMRAVLDTHAIDLIVMDVMMPGEDGLSAARRLTSERGPALIMLSALGTDTDRIIGLEIGADDYLAKPCNPRELLARVRAVLRRRQLAADAASGHLYEFAGWHLDVIRRALRDPHGTYINLSDGEFSLLRTFVEHPQRVLSRDQLLDCARGRDSEVFDRAIDSQISRLRRKINERGHTELIRTVRNEGYMLLPTVTRL